MEPLRILKEEHDAIERELLELETIMETETINYSNLSHVFKKLHNLWNSHEEKEEKIFRVVARKKIDLPVGKFLLEHRKLRKHKNLVNRAIESGSEVKMKEALESNGKFIISTLRAHMNAEEDMFYAIPLAKYSSSELKEIWKAIGTIPPVENF